MYTLPMSRSFRTLALGVTLLWALAPQIACFMPDEMTETEQECCRQMANDCAGSGMSHECCRTAVHSDVGTLVKAIRSVAPDFTVLGETFDATAAIALPHFGNLAAISKHAPPHDTGTSPVILRI